jgi:hypothetical protein
MLAFLNAPGETMMQVSSASLFAALPMACFSGLIVLLTFQAVARNLSVMQRAWIQIALFAPIAVFALTRDSIGILELSYFAVGVASALGLMSMALSAWNSRETRMDEETPAEQPSVRLAEPKDRKLRKAA